MTREDMAADPSPLIFTTDPFAMHALDPVTHGDTAQHDLLSPTSYKSFFSKRGNATSGDALSNSLLSLQTSCCSGIVTHGDTIFPGLLSPALPLSSEHGNVTCGDTLSGSLLSPPPRSRSGIVTQGDTISPGLLSPSASSPSSAAATTGDPAASIYLSPQFALDNATLFAQAARAWPAFNDLRAAASASKSSRLRIALGALVSEARVVFGAALLSARGVSGAPPSPKWGAAPTIHAWACFILREGLSSFASLWHWSHEQVALLAAQLSLLVRPDPWRCSDSCPRPTLLDVIVWDAPPREYPAVFCAFFHSLAAGCPWELAFLSFQALPPGNFSADGRVFGTPAFHANPHRDLARFPLGLHDPTDELTLFFDNSQLVAIASSHTVFPGHRHVYARKMVVSSRPDRGNFPSRLMPEYIRLKRDAKGWPVQPRGWVTSLVEHSGAWHTELGPLDAITAVVVDGKLSMPKPSFPTRGSWRPNHPSWERNEEAKRALGPKLAEWIAQGIVEVVPPWCQPPLFVEPLGAVDKATDPFWRLILDARISNEFHDEWGVWYLSIAALAALLDECDIIFAEDLVDAYHLSVFAGCTGRLQWVDMLVFGPDGTLIWQKRLVLGCDPSSCWGWCDKAMSGFCVEGFLMRFAAAHFGQRNAGSPLNAFMRTVLRFLASRQAPPPRRPAFTKRSSGPAAAVGPKEDAPPSPATAAPPAVVATLRAPAQASDLPAPARRGSVQRPCTAQSGWTIQRSSPRLTSTPSAPASTAAASSARLPSAALPAIRGTGTVWRHGWVSASGQTSGNFPPSARPTPAWW